jgi:hypothetical protein
LKPFFSPSAPRQRSIGKNAGTIGSNGATIGNNEGVREIKGCVTGKNHLAIVTHAAAMGTNPGLIANNGGIIPINADPVVASGPLPVT